MEQENQKLRWQTAEYEHHPKSAEWFWALGIIGIAGAASAFLVDNLLFAILILLGTFTLAMFAARKPEDVTVTISKEGLSINNRLYPYSTLESFWISPDENPRTLLVVLKNPLSPQLGIQIEEVSPDNIRIFLNKYLKEKEQDDISFFERIAKHFGI